MATAKVKTEPRSAMLDYSVYVPLGAGQVVAEKARGLFGKAWTVAQSPRKAAERTYRDLALRGERLARSVRRSVFARAAFHQTRTARSRVRTASTSVRKAAKKVG